MRAAATCGRATAAAAAVARRQRRARHPSAPGCLPAALPRPHSTAAPLGGWRAGAAAALPQQPPRPRLLAAAAAHASERPALRQRYVRVEPDGSDAWRLDPVVEALRGGAVGIIPTDSNLAFVCDLGSRAAVERLLAIKGARGSQRMSVLCRSLQDVDAYTQGWPPSRAPGQPDMFKLAKRVLPGPYTFILLAGKQLPKALTNAEKGRSKRRHEVGVRLPDDPVAQAILRQLDRPLLCSTAATGEEGGEPGPDAAALLDVFAPRGLDFVVDAGPRATEGTTVVDCTGAQPVVLRRGKGDPSFLE